MTSQWRFDEPEALNLPTPLSKGALIKWSLSDFSHKVSWKCFGKTLYATVALIISLFKMQ